MKPIIEYIKFKKLKELNISDLRHVRKSDWSNPYKITSFFLNQGYELLGTGGQASVYAKPGSNVAIKVTTAIDPAWRAFYDYAISNKGNKYLPKFGKITTILDKFYVVPMERLENLSSHNLYLPEFSSILNFLLYYPHKVPNINSLSTQSFLDGSLDEVLTVPSRPNLAYRAKEIAGLLNSKDPTLMNTILDIFNIALKNNFEIDLHGANIMQRSNGQMVVLVDPLIPTFN